MVQKLRKKESNLVSKIYDLIVSYNLCIPYQPKFLKLAEVHIPKQIKRTTGSYLVIFRVIFMLFGPIMSKLESKTNIKDYNFEQCRRHRNVTNVNL